MAEESSATAASDGTLSVAEELALAAQKAAAAVAPTARTVYEMKVPHASFTRSQGRDPDDSLPPRLLVTRLCLRI